MAISYPRQLPQSIGIAKITLMPEDAVGMGESPFNYKQQVVVHPGQRWMASVQIPNVQRNDGGEDWATFLTSLKGRQGTFYLGDPMGYNPRGYVKKVNLLTYSSDLSNASWNKNNCTTPTGGTDSNGEQGYNLLEASDVANQHFISHSVSYVAGVTYTLSFLVKNGTSNRKAFMIFPSAAFGTQQSVLFDPVTNIFSASSGSPTYTSVSTGSGWYRVMFTATATVTTTSVVNIYNHNSATSYNGDGTSYNTFGSFQVEASSAYTSYQKVTIAFGDTPLVKGAGQTGSELIIDNLNASVTTIFHRGDYIQLGTGSASKLHKILTRVDSNSSGECTLDIWPDLRSSPADNSAVYFEGTVGIFRLKSNIRSWEIDNTLRYGGSFDCMEAQ